MPDSATSCSLGQSVRWFLRPGSQGRWGTSNCLPDLEADLLGKAELPFWKEGGEVHPPPLHESLGEERANLEAPSVGTEQASRGSQEMQMVLIGRRFSIWL